MESDKERGSARLRVRITGKGKTSDAKRHLFFLRYFVIYKGENMVISMGKKRLPLEILLLSVICLYGCGAAPNERKAVAVNPMRIEIKMPSVKIEPPETDRGQTQNWQEAYRLFLDDWKLVEEYGDFGYLEMYFEEDYYFDKYFLCDIDENGTPELFLYSTNMRLTAVFTYTDEPVYLLYNNLYGINPETDEAVIHGHWHGAGGSWENEWSAYRITGDMSEYSMYIDYMGFREEGGEIRYTVFDVLTETYIHPEDSAEYDALYAAHVEPCILMENYRLYDMFDAGGFDDIQ